MSKDFTNRHEGGQKLSNLRCKSLGVIAIEVCFTLPVVIYLIFFTIELIKINITKDALQSICEEATYLTIAHDYENGADLINKIDAIVEKYRPIFIPKEAPGYTAVPYPVIRWCFETYPMFGESDANTITDEMLEELVNMGRSAGVSSRMTGALYPGNGDMLSYPPYGGSTIAYPPYETNRACAVHASQGYPIAGALYTSGGGVANIGYGSGSAVQFIPSNGQAMPSVAERSGRTIMYMAGEGLPDNRVFVITVTCNYQFSSSMVKWLFNGGSNTNTLTSSGGSDNSETVGGINSSTIGYGSMTTITASPGTMYLLWARGAGIVNAK